MIAFHLMADPVARANLMADPADIRASFPAWGNNNEKNKDKLPMRWLFAVDRRSGQLVWKQKSAGGFSSRAVAIGNGPPSEEAFAALRSRRAACTPLVGEHIDWALERLSQQRAPAEETGPDTA